MTLSETMAHMRAELAAAINGAPWAIDKDYLVYLSGFARPLVVQGEGMKAISPTTPRRAVATGDNIAVLNLAGVITPKPTFFSMFFGGTALTDFAAELEAAVNDPKVAGIVINVDSPGGMIDLVTETAAQIRAAKAVKPIIAVANTDAASAAYWLAAQADELIVTPSGEVGSIGVYTVHTDRSGAEAQAGLKTTLISAGKYKVEGNPYEPLTEEAAAALQSRIDTYYSMFVADVAAGRGVTTSAVTAGYGQGRIVAAQDAKTAGMVDGVGTLAEVLAGFATKLGGGKMTAEAISPSISSALHERARFEQHRFLTG